jgi:hypothetical protein
VQAEWLLRRADRAEAAAPVGAAGAGAAVERSRSGQGWYVQTGLMLGPGWQVAARWSTVAPLASDRSGLAGSREVGAALSRYVRGHDFKIQLDAFHLRADGVDDALRLRLQTQLWF